MFDVISFFTESRELSIQQLEERKRADEERKKKEKSVEKNIPKEITLTTEIVFVQKKEKHLLFSLTLIQF